MAWPLTRLAVLCACFAGAAVAQASVAPRFNRTPAGASTAANTSLRVLDDSVGGGHALPDGTASAEQTRRAWMEVSDRCKEDMAFLAAATCQREVVLATGASPAAATADAPGVLWRQLFRKRAPARQLLPMPAAAAGAAAPTSVIAPVRPAARYPGWKPLWLLGGVIMAEILCWKMLTRLCGKCPNCHQWFARVELHRLAQANDSAALPVLRRRRFRHRSLATNPGNAERERRRSVPLRRHNQCCMCLHEWETTSRGAR